MLLSAAISTLRLTTDLRPKYVFHERDDNLAFCPILHVLSLAFADQAFLSPWLQEPKDLYTFRVEDDRGLESLPLEWKPDMLDLPLLRRATDTAAPWKYGEARAPNARLGTALGFKDPFHFYALRRGAGEAIDGKHTIFQDDWHAND